MNTIQLKSFAETLEKLALDISPELGGGLLGALGAGAAGYGMTDDPRKKVRNALLAALAGGAGGAVLGGAMSGGEAPVDPKKIEEMTRQRFLSDPTKALEAVRADAARKVLSYSDQERLYRELANNAQGVAFPSLGE